MIKQIRRVAIIGMGALGIMYGHFLSKALGDLSLVFIADRRRQERYAREGVFFNGEACQFTFMDPSEEPEKPADLLIFATKGTQLEQAVKDAARHVGEDTVIISFLNGITSEQIIGQAFGMEHVVYCVVQGTDATRTGCSVSCRHRGKIVLGIPADEFDKRPVLERAMLFLQEASIPYLHDQNMRHRLYSKWMLNVGVNQVVTVWKGTYGTVQQEGEAREAMKAAMREAMLVARRERVPVSDDDLDFYVRLVDGLDPGGMPSMRQDSLAGRATEVEFFAGTVIRKAEALGLDVPVNRRLYRQIKDMEQVR